MPRLPKPLGEMITLWTEEYRQRFMAPGGRERTDLEQAFAEDAKDRVTAMAAIGQVLDTLITSDIGQPAAHFMSAPEGISKSRSLIANTPRFQKLLEENGLPPLIMFAFGNYDMAKEKAVEFEAAHPAPRFGMSFKPLVVPSFSRLYKETCAKLKVKEITMEVACGLRAKSVNDAIRDHQPEVINEMRRFYRGLHAKMAGKRPVLFTVHDVAHDWIKTTQTRLMFAPSYWNTSLDDNARRMAAREDTKLGLLIHDEVSAENLTLAHRAETVAWVREGSSRRASGRPASESRTMLHLNDAPDDYLANCQYAGSYFYADATRITFLTVSDRYFGWYDDGPDQWIYDLEALPNDVIFGLDDDRRPQRIIAPVVEWMFSEQIRHKAFYLDQPDDRAIAIRFDNPFDALRAINLFPERIAKRKFWVWTGEREIFDIKATPHTVMTADRETGEAWCADQATGYWRVTENQTLAGDQTVSVDGGVVVATGRMATSDWTFHFEKDRDAALFKLFWC
jgi:hypothetical protein